MYEHELDYNGIKLEEGSVSYGEVKGKKMIFCEGHKVIENPWFSHLPWVPAKGEMLTVRLEQGFPDKIINGGKWLMPIGEGMYRAGASYSWEDLDDVRTEKGREQVIEGLKAILKMNRIEIIDQLTGIRPCTRDMRPYIGLHKEHKSLGILNGLGSKGTMMGPYYARAMSDFLETGKSLDCEVSVVREELRKRG